MNIPTYAYQDLSNAKRKELCQRPSIDFEEAFTTVQPIIEKFSKEGDAGIRYYSEKFDYIDTDPLTFNPQEQSVSIDTEIKQAIDIAFDNICRFHQAQMPEQIEVETTPGITCRQMTRPIQNVGLYVPGGTALLPSTLMMLGIPASIAGCKHITAATPPLPDGTIADELIYIAQRIGIQQILKAGGAQAISGLAFGTESIRKADKIAGPGNQYVTAAKMQLQNSKAQISIDMPAGPSEVLIIVDGSPRPPFVAADLLSQAEHGTDSQAILVATKNFDQDHLRQTLSQQLDRLPRNDIARRALENSFVLTVDDLKQAFHFSNRYAPEHLIIQCTDARRWTEHIHNAGSVFLGQWTPESAGDYASGTNHTLPTYGYARMYSGLSTTDFL